MKKYLMPVMMLAIFEVIAITLWLTMDNLFSGANYVLGVFNRKPSILYSGS